MIRYRRTPDRGRFIPVLIPVLMAVLMAVLSPSLPAAAQDGGQVTSLKAAETPWTVSCGSAMKGLSIACQIDKQLRTVNPDALVSMITVLVIDGKPAMRIVAPHELFIPNGLSLQVDGKDIGRKAFTTSVTAGIVALFELDGETLNALRTGQKLRALAKLRTGQDFSLTVLLDGFDAGVNDVIR